MFSIDISKEESEHDEKSHERYSKAHKTLKAVHER